MQIKTRLNTADYGNSELNRDSKNESFDNPNLIHSPPMARNMQLTHACCTRAYILPLRLSSLH